MCHKNRTFTNFKGLKRDESNEESKAKVSPALASITYLKIVSKTEFPPERGFRDQVALIETYLGGIDTMQANEMLNIPEGSERIDPGSLAQYNERHLTRVYPKGTRIGANLD